MLLIFGYGYTAQAFAHRIGTRARLVATVRSAEKADALTRAGLTLRIVPGPDDAALRSDIRDAEAVLVTAPPGPEGDPFLAAFGEALASAPRLAWIGYLSTVGVYGDHGGGWVDEATPASPGSARSKARLAAEKAWLAFGRRKGCRVAVFRLPGIYGPGRSAFERLQEGSAKRLVKPGQVFNRAHVEDIAAVLEAAWTSPEGNGIFNVADDEPAPPQDVILEAARLMGVEPPREEAFDPALLSPMARSFYEENKRVRNDLIKTKLGVRLLYPTYREGLEAIWRTMRGA